MQGKPRIGLRLIARRIPAGTAGALQNFTELAQSRNAERPRCRCDLYRPPSIRPNPGPARIV
jgi:hypothetical protein